MTEVFVAFSMIPAALRRRVAVIRAFYLLNRQVRCTNWLHTILIQTLYYSTENDSVPVFKANTFSAAIHRKVALKQVKTKQVCKITAAKLILIT